MANSVESRVPWWTWIAWVAAAVLLLLAIGPIARFASTSSDWLDYPYPRPGSEGLILYESLLFKHGGDIYAPITTERFISGPYPPIYYWLAASLLPDTLPDFSTPSTVTSIFEPGRTVSLVSTIIAALLLPIMVIFNGGYARRDRRTILTALFAGLLSAFLFLSLPQVMVWATRFRGDMLMIALTAAGLTCIAVGSGRARFLRASWLWLLAAALLFSLAFFTKQTALAGPIAAALYLLLRDWRTGLRWCVAMGLLVLVPFAILDFATNHWFYLKMVTYHSLPLRGLTLTRLLQFAFWEDQWPLILLAIAQAAIVILPPLRHLRKRDIDTRSFLIPIFTLSTAATLPTGAVVGADHNHLLMSGLAIAAATGAILAQILVSFTLATHPTTPRWAASLTAFALLVIYILFTSPPSSWYDPDLVKPSPDRQEQLRKIVLNVSNNPGSLFFSDDPGLLALAGKQTTYDDPFTMTALAPQNRWDESTYRNHLAHGDFALLLLSCDVTTTPNTCRADTFTPGVLDAIRSGYTLLFRDIIFTYAPK